MRKYSSPRGAIHDLARIDELGTDRTILLCISPRTHYLLQNLAGLDVGFKARYATDLLEGGYEPVVEDGPLWSLFVDVVEAFVLEVQDVDCEITAKLDEVIAAIEGQTAGDCWSGIYGIPGYEGAPYFDPTPSEDPPPGSELKCQLAWSLCWRWEEAMIDLLQKFELGAGLSAGAIAIILSLCSLPIVAIAGIALLLISLVLDYSIEETEEAIEGLVADLACAIWVADTVGDALTAVHDLIDADPKLNAATASILKWGFTANNLNAVWAETFPVDPGAPTDCSECAPECDEWYIFLGEEVSSGEGFLELDPVLDEGLYKIHVYWDTYAVGEGRAYCPYEDGVDVTDIASTNLLVGGYIYDRNNDLIDEFHLYPPNGNLPEFPYEGVGYLTMTFNSGQTGRIMLEWSQPE